MGKDSIDAFFGTARCVHPLLKLFGIPHKFVLVEDFVYELSCSKDYKTIKINSLYYLEWLKIRKNAKFKKFVVLDREKFFKTFEVLKQLHGTKYRILGKNCWWFVNQLRKAVYEDADVKRIRKMLDEAYPDGRVDKW